jgi:serine-type D-Ala-D-Ala carboxypeptidase/endopeptidase (penicillin-binding protein 4)
MPDRMVLARALALALASALPCVAEPAQVLPPPVLQALHQAKVPTEAVSVLVQSAGDATTRLSLNPSRMVNPASLTKLLTTYAALDTLGPAWTWRTPVWLNGKVQDGVLAGSLVIKGYGDPKLTIERVWLLLRRVQQLGVHEIRGDIVLDHSAFVVPDGVPGEFDGEPLRPYNVRPDALLLNLKAVQYSFTPDPARNIALIGAEPALAGVQVDTRVPLSDAPCDDWHASLRALLADPLTVRFVGSYPAACGERTWPVAYPDPASYNARLIEALWQESGGRLTGQVHDGSAPADVVPSFELQSPPLAEVVRDINKFSNNVMAQQLFLTLAYTGRGIGSVPAARETLGEWLQQRHGATPQDFVLDNGSGLSRDTRLSVQLLARVLQAAWRSPVMPELIASLPVIGLDGTLRRSAAQAGRAHLKTGSLRDVVGVAGYVLGTSGQRYVLVAIINHPNANAARPALDALVQWAMEDAMPGR